ncbi:MAG TPA: MarR family winged helix-turn-helix transcriptional regulator [Terriglobales bacterium]|nr:MarR family winged helix-turn-helix transcriptional regulator [Terriglobales bacterium]
MPNHDQLKPLAPAEYVALAEFRYQLRRYLRYMEEEARANGHHPQQYQLLLAIKGLPKGKEPTVSALAERMQMNHNSMVGLINRCEKRGLIRRSQSNYDRRQVTLAITRQGDLVLRQQANASRNELGSISPILFDSLERLMKSRLKKSSPKEPRRSKQYDSITE